MYVSGLKPTSLKSWNTSSTCLYCARTCYAQSMPPSIQENQMADFLTFCVVRDAITELRPVMSSRRAFKRLIQEYERHDDGEKALWVRVLQHMYNNSKTPIYSILAMRDPCVRHFHQLIQTAITLSCPRLFFVALLRGISFPLLFSSLRWSTPTTAVEVVD